MSNDSEVQKNFEDSYRNTISVSQYFCTHDKCLKVHIIQRGESVFLTQDLMTKLVNNFGYIDPDKLPGAKDDTLYTFEDYDK